MPALLDVGSTLGAILIGCFIAAALSGVVTSQTCIYYRLYLRDSTLNKLTVAFIWVMDVLHTCLICTSAWQYLIANWGNVEINREGFVPITVTLSVGVTAFITLVTHLFFLRRLLHLSKNNWFIIGPTFLIAIGRVVAALVTTVELSRLQSLPAFVAKYKFVFTIGLSFSSAVDIVITTGMCYYLRENRRGFGTMDGVIDSIIFYTISNGSVTCISTIASMICWLAIPNTLIFLGIHFGIAKLYANSLIATLNMRQGLRGRSVLPRERELAPVFLNTFHRNKHNQPAHDPALDLTTCNDAGQLHITVEKTVDYDVEEVRKSGPSSEADSPSLFQVEHAV